jgi:hypothetical protein
MPGVAGVLSYTPIWPVRLEFFGGTGNRSFYDYQQNTSLDFSMHVKTFGFQARWFLTSFLLSPYLLTGLGWAFGDFSASYYNMNNYYSQTADTSVHSFYSGVGLDFQWEWLHLAVGYRLAWAFYKALRDPSTGNHLDTPPNAASKGLGDMLDDAMSGVELQIGARF